MISYNPLAWRGVGVGKLNEIIIFKIFLTGFLLIQHTECNDYLFQFSLMLKDEFTANSYFEALETD